MTVILQNLISEAKSEATTEASRQLQICNACRYCEGFCAVFPAMTRRLEFPISDVHYLANLCHNCGACLHACQYAAPHEFGVNIPKVMAQVRGETYQHYAWPAPFGRLYERNGLTLSVALVLALALFLLAAAMSKGGLFALATASNNFYHLFPHGLLVAMFLPVFAFVVLALGIGVRKFWHDISPVTSGAALTKPALLEATHDAAKLKYLDGGHGEGCHNESDAWTQKRRRAHHLTFYGFILCFLATSVATLYHYCFGWIAPYDLPSLPKVLGAMGGVSLSVGTAWLWRLNRNRHPEHGDAAQKPMDLGFIALLFLTATSGLALWLSRGSAALPLLLCLHLAAVMALFVTLPYGKFAHGVYRVAAMLRYAVERR